MLFKYESTDSGGGVITEIPSGGGGVGPDALSVLRVTSEISHLQVENNLLRSDNV